MDNFVITKPASQNSSDSDPELQPPESAAATGARKMWTYKDKLDYNPLWKKKYAWMEYDSMHKVWCALCARSMEKILVQA